MSMALRKSCRDSSGRSTAHHKQSRWSTRWLIGATLTLSRARLARRHPGTSLRVGTRRAMIRLRMSAELLEPTDPRELADIRNRIIARIRGFEKLGGLDSVLGVEPGRIS